MAAGTDGARDDVLYMFGILLISPSFSLSESSPSTPPILLPLVCCASFSPIDIARI
jgi:hypothetical protein